MNKKDASAATQPKTVLFLHIPKTAGATLKRFISHNYDPSKVFNVLQRGKTSPEFLQNLPSEEKSCFQVVYGHFYYGLHACLPQPVTYITLLRDPVDRVLSHYYYVLKTPMHRLHQQVVSQSMSLMDYVTAGLSDELDNGQLRLISGMQGVPIGECTPQMLRTAKDNLSRDFSAVGLTERFEESMNLMQHIFQWKPAPYENLNVNQKRRSKAEVPSDVLRHIESMNQLDIELYQFAAERFSKDCNQIKTSR